MRRLNWGTIGAILFCVMLWIAFGVGAFKCGVWVEQEQSFVTLDSLGVELDTANAKIDRMADWTRECWVTHVFRNPSTRVLTAQMICPDTIDIEVNR